MCFLRISKVKYNDETDDKDDLIDELNNISPTPFDDIFETILDINPVMPEEELLHKIIDERFLVGELITHGRIGTLRNGKATDFHNRTYSRFERDFGVLIKNQSGSIFLNFDAFHLHWTHLLCE